MGLIQCPDCSNQVSDAAPSCPKCGGPMEESSKSSFLDPDSNFKSIYGSIGKKGSYGVKNWFSFQLLGLLLGLLLLLYSR